MVWQTKRGMMPVAIAAPPREVLITAEALCQESFAQFGTVIQNPAPSVIPSTKIPKLPLNAVQANQGSALKYLDITHMKDFYASVPSKKPAKAVMNMFVCAPRSLVPARDPNLEGYFPVEILERHPYTTQTFIPLGLSASEAHQARYVIIVAPTLPPTIVDQGLPVPPTTISTGPLPGRGLPDLQNLQAFIADGSQAVTYGAGTWHAPMVVVGRKPIDFVVVQFANGVAIEDCQEAELGPEKREHLSVAVGLSEAKSEYYTPPSKL